MIVATIYMVIASIAVAAPLGIMTAIYLTEYAKVGSKLVKVIRFFVLSHWRVFHRLSLVYLV
ncbi:hypothetical protein QW180_24650 [Vibrio sinaloensis]|nr:hypothetical protein [Vibrio sinaloensis]